MPKTSSTIDQIVDLILDLSKELKKIDGANPNDLWSLIPGRDPSPEFVAARGISDRLIDILQSQNRDMLSEHIILDRAVYHAAAFPLQKDLDDEELKEIARVEACKLINYEAWRIVKVAIISLQVEEGPYRFGPVTFIPFSEADEESNMWKKAARYLMNSNLHILQSYGVVRVPGDVHLAIKKAEELLEDALLILRGIGFPLVADDVHQIGIINQYPLGQSIPYHLDPPDETNRIEHHSQEVTKIGPPIFPYRLHQDLLCDISDVLKNSFLGIINEHGYSPRSDIHSKLIKGFRWLGEASKPGILEARFAKVAFSLEALVGGEPNENRLTTRGITATLAERAAFLVADEYETRKSIDQAVRRHYGKRSAIVHGGISAITPQDFEDFAKLTRRIAWSFLEKADQFSNVNELQSWVNRKKYGG